MFLDNSQKVSNRLKTHKKKKQKNKKAMKTISRTFSQIFSVGFFINRSTIPSSKSELFFAIIFRCRNSSWKEDHLFLVFSTKPNQSSIEIVFRAI